MTRREKSFGILFAALLVVFPAALIGGCGDSTSDYTKGAWRHPLPAAEATASKTVDAAKRSVDSFVKSSAATCLCRPGNHWNASAAACRDASEGSGSSAG